MAASAKIVEVFTSIQGEGIYVGERQIFIRFAGCNLACQYCDSPQALNFPENKKPVELNDLLTSVDLSAKNKSLIHSVCLTGGEPLLQVDFLKQLLPEIKKRGLLSYLETNGVLFKHLEEIIDLIDIIAFDIKLPSATGMSSYFEDHKKTLEIAALKDVFVKIVFTRESKTKELDDACKIIESINPDIPLVLQPVTPHGPIKHWPKPEEILSFQSVAKRRIKKVLVIPQTHKIMGLI